VSPPPRLTSCTPTKSNLYWDFFCHCPERTCPIRTSHIPSTKSHIHFLSLGSFIQGIHPVPRLLFYCEELLAPRPTPKLEDHPLSAVHDLLFNIFAATLHTWRVSPPSATWERAMLWWQETHLTWRSKIHKLINSIWHKEKLPDQYKVSIIVPVHKKGDKTDCNNYHGISLLSTSYKILSNILLSRLNPYIDEIIGDHQCGFWHNRSTTDQIFCIHQILERGHAVA
jgi:hypothetical protein